MQNFVMAKRLKILFTEFEQFCNTYCYEILTFFIEFSLLLINIPVKMIFM